MLARSALSQVAFARHNNAPSFSAKSFVLQRRIASTTSKAHEPRLWAGGAAVAAAAASPFARCADSGSDRSASFRMAAGFTQPLQRHDAPPPPSGAPACWPRALSVASSQLDPLERGASHGRAYADLVLLIGCS
jgi:hypothetical protein